jgi:ABC-2 type transport system permease protein
MPGPFPTAVDWQIARRGFARYAAYPAATYAGLFTNTVFGFLRAYVLLAVFQLRDTVGGYDTAATLTYVWLTQALIATVYIWGWNELALRIRTGDIATDLIRPIHPLRAGLAFDYGRAVYHALFRGVPPLLVGAFVFRLVAPADLLQWVAFAVSVILAIGVSYAYRLLYNLVAFWMLDNRGAMMTASVIATLFSGFLIPVPFFPSWLATIANATPFPAMIQTPIDIFVGVTAGPAAVGALLTQLAWAVVLLLAARAVFALGVRRLVVQGG